MHGFPAKELLTASDTDQLRQALVTIFSHLKRFRKTKYPVQRCQHLILAISRDLSAQLNSILSNMELMRIRYARKNIKHPFMSIHCTPMTKQILINETESFMNFILFCNTIYINTHILIHANIPILTPIFFSFFFSFILSYKSVTTFFLPHEKLVTRSLSVACKDA